jgi:hypothetical protein
VISLICLWVFRFEGDGSVRDGENQRNGGDAFNPTRPNQPDQSAPDQPTSLFPKPDGFSGFHSGSGLGFFKPAGLGLGGQKAQNLPKPTRAHPYPRLHCSLIWQNLYQIHACEAQIYRSMEDSPPPTLQRRSVSSCTCPTHYHKASIASVAMLDDISDVFESKSRKISTLQASTRSRASRRICLSLMCLHGVPRATLALDPFST